MQRSIQRNNQEIISMEQYLCKRQAIREKELKRTEKRTQRVKEKSPAFMLAELYI